MRLIANHFLGRPSMGALLLALGLPGTAVAATNQADATAEPSDTQGDIVVTAQRREQSLQDVAVAVTAIGEDTMRASGITQSL
ncbi:MAG: hypothetical protein RBT81_12200 [Gammaproteobacteria bacterium]|jgi:outer membrane receptor protein involved in Fe transport|nr:hypothetical protein [Gammaproteobacteria bacterium]